MHLKHFVTRISLILSQDHYDEAGFPASKIYASSSFFI